MTWTEVGAMVGLATGVFTFWDRWLRGRPLAWLTVTIRTGGTPADPCIHIKNPGPTDLLIERVRTRPPEPYSVAKDHSIKAISSAALEGVDVHLLLRPGQEHELAIVDRRLGVAQKGVSQRVRFSIYWRKTSSTWLPQFPVVIHTSTKGIQQIIDAASA
jgi:hypothetical protein